MPHKRARRQVREREKAQRATDLAPKITVEHEPVPKSVSRVLNAGQIRREYREKKRQFEGGSHADGDNLCRKKGRHDAGGVNDGGERALKIKPGETVPQFNRRVENTMVPLIKTALRQSSAQARKVRKEEAQEKLKRGIHGERARQPHPVGAEKGSDPPPGAAVQEGSAHPRNPAKEFEAVSTSAPRRLNDIAQEPPSINRLPRGVIENNAAPSGVLSMAQKAMMEVEREKAIKHYRELRARKLRENGGAKLDADG